MAKSELVLKGLVLRPVRTGIWRLEPQGKMRVGVHFVGSRALLEKLADDQSLDQATHVACLPGVVDPVLTMPDIHQGYGFPIGGVAAFRLNTGVVSPGGVGYDINCGVRMLRSEFSRQRLKDNSVRRRLADALFEAVPCGVGSRRGDFTLTDTQLGELLVEGARWAVGRGFGLQEDSQRIEEGGRLPGANPDAVSERARERGLNQLGTLGSGNHFLEVQYVDAILDEKIATAFGLWKDQIVVTIHTGSRGLGYQVCADSIDESFRAAHKYGIELPHRELAAAPLDSAEGRHYLEAMAAAANFAFGNRQVITHWVREVFQKEFGGRPLEVLYDVCHNIAKFEELPIGGHQLKVCIHRKGATRAYPPNHPQVPPVYREVGQPILIPGDMGRYSFVLAGQKGSLEQSLGSACHGAGRELSRSQAKKRGQGRALAAELEEKGIFVRTAGKHTLIEEMPEAYKDVSEVVSATEAAGIAKTVARLKPMVVVKG